ncbi:MAG: SGNH/GDSL hydrolase family protein [Bacteroidota bacterium]
MKTILCYGDSNTWGYIPGTAERYGRNIRWPKVMQQHLGAGYEVIEEALNGRTTVHEDFLEEGRNGITYLTPCLISHAPIDLVILKLGVNDLKHRFSVPASDIADGVRKLSWKILKSDSGPNHQPPKLLIVTPPPMGKLSQFADMFEGGPEKSRQFSRHYQAVADELGCAYLDAGAHVVSSDVDGIHWEADQHVKLGGIMAEKVKQLCESED